MTAPKRDGRSLLERGRELIGLDPFPFHERSTEGQTVLRAAMRVVEAAQRATLKSPELSAALEEMRMRIVT